VGLKYLFHFKIVLFVGLQKDDSAIQMVVWLFGLFSCPLRRNPVKLLIFWYNIAVRLTASEMINSCEGDDLMIGGVQ